MRQLLFLASFLCCLNLHGQEQATEILAEFLGDNKNEICYFAGELATIGTATGAFVICMETGGATCPVALHLMQCAQDPVCNNFVKRITTVGCSFLITKTEDVLRVYGKTNSDNVGELKKVYERLNTVSGMYWLMSHLQ